VRRPFSSRFDTIAFYPKASTPKKKKSLAAHLRTSRAHSSIMAARRLLIRSSSASSGRQAPRDGQSDREKSAASHGRHMGVRFRDMRYLAVLPTTHCPRGPGGSRRKPRRPSMSSAPAGVLRRRTSPLPRLPRALVLGPPGHAPCAPAMLASCRRDLRRQLRHPPLRHGGGAARPTRPTAPTSSAPAARSA